MRNPATIPKMIPIQDGGPSCGPSRLYSSMASSVRSPAILPRRRAGCQEISSCPPCVWCYTAHSWITPLSYPEPPLEATDGNLINRQHLTLDRASQHGKDKR